MTTAIATLNPAAQVALASCEQRIERGLKTFIDVGQALAEIRDSRLYKGTHDTFEAYLEGRWGMSRAHAYRMISAAEVVSPMGDIEAPPTNERQTRELAKVPEAERADVWREATERTGGKPTAAAVREVAAERTQTPEPAAPVDVPTVAAGSGPGLKAKIRADLAEVGAEGITVSALGLYSPLGLDAFGAAVRELVDAGEVVMVDRDSRGAAVWALTELVDELGADDDEADFEVPVHLNATDRPDPQPLIDHARVERVHLRAAERIAAVAEVAPEFVKPVEPEAPKPTLRLVPTEDEKRAAVQRDARGLLLRVVEILAPDHDRPGFAETWARQLGPYDAELSDLIRRAREALATLDDLIEGCGQ